MTTEREGLELDRRVLEIIGWRRLRYDEDDEEEPWHGISPEGLPGCCHTGDCASDEALVVPLAEALRARGKARGEDWFIKMTLGEKWRVAIKSGMIGRVLAEAKADTLPLALAKAAAQAVGTEQER